MHILVAGLSHKTAPVSIREKLTFSTTTLGEALHAIFTYPHINEAVIVSTCNRTEVYVVCDDLEGGKKDIVSFLGDFNNLDRDEVSRYLYFHDSHEAVHHLFRVAASLDSMVIGEAQILGQLKEAYACSFEAEATNVVLNRLFRHSFAVGKKVRTETEIGDSAVSISYAAVELAKKVFEDLRGRTAIIIGAGEMSELTTKYLVANGVKSVLVANRTYERAVELAERFSGRAVKFDELSEYIAQADIIISSTGAPHYIIKKEDVAKAMQKRRNNPIFFIDIAVPRDVDPEVNNIYNAFLYDIDDLQSVVDANLSERAREAKRAEVIVESEVEDFISWLSSLEVVPTISALKEVAEIIRQQEMGKALNKLGSLTDRDKNIINALTSVIVNKLLHQPIIRVKECADRKDGYLYIESLRHLFDLEESAGAKGKVHPARGRETRVQSEGRSKGFKKEEIA